ncbi:sensor histidine kinase [Roseateles sp. GG27B]
MQTSQQGSVRLLLDLDSVRVGMDQAAPCGLLVNELISNSLKHAFPEGRSGWVRVALQAVPDVDVEARVKTDAGTGLGTWRLSVSDNGVGLPADFVRNSGHSLGLLLVDDLARQLHGRLDVERGNKGEGAGEDRAGVAFSVTFKLDPVDVPLPAADV